MWRTLRLCRFHSAMLQGREKAWPPPAAHFQKSCRSPPARALRRASLSGTALAVPLLLGVRYFPSEPRERRRMRLTADGIGRFGRSLRIGLLISLDYCWCANVVLPGVEEDSPGYMEVMSACHQCAADALVAGAQKKSVGNGGCVLISVIVLKLLRLVV